MIKMKRELIEEIYKQKFECEEEVKFIDTIKYQSIGERYIKEYNFNEGKKKELENNIIFCEELLDIIVKDEN